MCTQPMVEAESSVHLPVGTGQCIAGVHSGDGERGNGRCGEAGATLMVSRWPCPVPAPASNSLTALGLSVMWGENPHQYLSPKADGHCLKWREPGALPFSVSAPSFLRPVSPDGFGACQAPVPHGVASG